MARCCIKAVPLTRPPQGSPCKLWTPGGLSPPGPSPHSPQALLLPLLLSSPQLCRLPRLWLENRQRPTQARCVHSCIVLCACVHTCVCVPLCTRVCTGACVYCACVHKCTRVYCACVHTCMCVPLCTFVHGCSCMCTLCMCAHVHVCVCVCVCARVCLCERRAASRRGPAGLGRGFKAAFAAAGVSAPDKQPGAEALPAAGGCVSELLAGSQKAVPGPASRSISPRREGGGGRREGGKKYLLQPLITEFEIPASRCHLFSEAVKAGFSI